MRLKLKKLDWLYKKAKRVKVDSRSKVVIIADLHRGNKYWNKNSSYIAKFHEMLSYYNHENFIYIEAGDTDELWKNKKIKKYNEKFKTIFNKLKEMKSQNRLYMIFGNHDKVKDTKKKIKEYWQVEQGIVLEYEKNKIFVTHGHQGELMYDYFWLLSRFYDRYLKKIVKKIKKWFNIKTSKVMMVKIEKQLKYWANSRNTILIAGHTHRLYFENDFYFNPGGIEEAFKVHTIEIRNKKLSLIKWIFNKEEKRMDRVILKEKSDV